MKGAKENHISNWTKPIRLTRDISIIYNDPHDMAAIIEVALLDVYGIKSLARGDAVLDLGAGVGEFSVFSSKRVGRSGLVISVEPSPQDYEALVRNVKDNGCSNVVTLRGAFSASRGKLDLRFKDHSFSAETVSLQEVKRQLQDCKRDG
ncbi:methyltransferase FkbM family, partial [mine drainage metagenome]